MREILFRGKTLTGKWVEGAYYKQEEFYGDKEDAHIIITSKETLENDLALESHIVIPETVGQYTGLTDNYGTKIFEGDIVEYKEENGTIVYDEQLAMFSVQFDTWCTDFDHIYSNELEVIDNIHNNPELLGGEDDG